MKLLELVKNGFFLISNAGNSDALFEEVYGLLYSEGYVKKEFLAEVKKRERNYPTGLQMGNNNIALPHVDACYVQKNALVICKLKRPIKFKRMDENSQEIEVKIVFFLIISDVSIHVDTISSLKKVWQCENIMNQFNVIETKQELMDCFLANGIN